MVRRDLTAIKAASVAGMSRSSRAHRRKPIARPRPIPHRHAIHAAGDFAPSGAHAFDTSSAPADRTQAASANDRSRCVDCTSSSTSTPVSPGRSTSASAANPFEMSSTSWSTERFSMPPTIRKGCDTH